MSVLVIELSTGLTPIWSHSNGALLGKLQTSLLIAKESQQKTHKLLPTDVLKVTIVNII